MAGSLEEPTKQLALDTDWVTAVVTVMSVIFATFFAALMASAALTKRWHPSKPSWTTLLFWASGVAILLGVRDRKVKIVLSLLLACSLVEVVAFLMHASAETQRLLSLGDRWVGAGVFAGLAVSGIVWFKHRIRHV